MAEGLLVASSAPGLPFSPTQQHPLQQEPHLDLHHPHQQWQQQDRSPGSPAFSPSPATPPHSARPHPHVASTPAPLSHTSHGVHSFSTAPSPHARSATSFPEGPIPSSDSPRLSPKLPPPPLYSYAAHLSPPLHTRFGLRDASPAPPSGTSPGTHLSSTPIPAPAGAATSTPAPARSEAAPRRPKLTVVVPPHEEGDVRGSRQPASPHGRVPPPQVQAGKRLSVRLCVCVDPCLLSKQSNWQHTWHAAPHPGGGLLSMCVRAWCLGVCWGRGGGGCMR